jgi:mono/diheme cytochrome c family protein
MFSRDSTGGVMFCALVCWCAVMTVSTGRGTIQAVTPTSTMDGVYTAAQATRGEETYMALCVACHPTVMHTGDPFKVVWGGRPLADLFGSITEKMPKNDPGTLSGAETAQVIAYLLKLNDVPTGKTDLPEDAEALKGIRIEVPSMGAEKKSRETLNSER